MNLLGHTGEELPDSEKMFKNLWLKTEIGWLDLIHNPQTESEAENEINLNQEETE